MEKQWTICASRDGEVGCVSRGICPRLCPAPTSPHGDDMERQGYFCEVAQSGLRLPRERGRGKPSMVALRRSYPSRFCVMEIKTMRLEQTRRLVIILLSYWLRASREFV